MSGLTADKGAGLSYRPCVGVMLVNSAGQVFVGQRADMTEPAWQMPQGGIDKGESPKVAALRELQEETGVDPSLVRLEAETADWVSYDFPAEVAGKIAKGKYRGQTQKWFLLRFEGQDAQVRIDTSHPEFSEWRWVSPDDLLDLIVPFKRGVYASVLDEFRPLL